jgi:nicotinamidase-related amidase
MMTPENTALILIGFQNDYFGEEGILKAVVEESSRANNVVDNTVALIGSFQESPLMMIETPIVFTDDYSELNEPVGILKAIKGVGAFRAGTTGGETIKELSVFGDRISCVPGKRGLNAFSNTDLEQVLREHEISNVVLAGTVTSICIDSTGRSAHEKGFKVFVLEDCTSGRSVLEQDFYCEQIFPLYAEVITSGTLRERMTA